MAPWLKLASILTSLSTERFVSDLLSLPQVRCRDPVSLTQRLQIIKNDGHNNLAVLSDFDYTLSKAYASNGEYLWSTLGVFRNFFPEEPRFKLIALYNRCILIENDSNMSYDDKLPFMRQCALEAHKIYFSTGITRNLIRQWSLMAKIQLRDGTKSWSEYLEEKDIPMLIFSAGVTDIIEVIVQKELSKIPKNLRVISNALVYDDLGKSSAFKPPLIHIFNKNVSTIEQEESPLIKSFLNHKNVLLMGDNLADLYMGKQENSQGATLKIGFFNNDFGTVLERYLEGFDIVLIEDETMEIPTLLTKFLVEK
ncbi:unnamed protein product, partial [Mesorhabditis belari]|uniref:5'-nucleotidase n=1 Tax=Mesorhabditis belari TaxID=2138241 RepID=A0AAF3ENN2_9BILA